MKTPQLIAILAAAAAFAPATSCASGVALSTRKAPTVVQAGHACPTGGCRQGAACSECRVQVFAGVDGATPPPCSADGVCYPKRDTYGFFHTRWRRWPGDYDTRPSEPTEATEGDELLAPFDTPPPEKEDQQAPPPIEEDPGAQVEGEEDDLPPLEIDLPPLPERRPFDRQFGPAEGEEPPPPPFGFAPTKGPMMTWRPQTSGDDAPDVRRLPKLPDEKLRQRGGPDSGRTRTAVRSSDAPPPLPGGFTMSAPDATPGGAARIPALGRPSAHYDSAVRQASATGPAGAPAAR